MAAYLIIDYDVTDEAVFRSFLEQVPAVVEAHGAASTWRAAALRRSSRETGTPRRIVVLEFDSVERAKGWQNAPDYADLRQMLNRSSNADVVIVERV